MPGMQGKRRRCEALAAAPPVEACQRRRRARRSLGDPRESLLVRLQSRRDGGGFLRTKIGVVVGQAPSAVGQDGKDASRQSTATPFQGTAGRRFYESMGLSESDFWELFDRTNVLDKWPGHRRRRHPVDPGQGGETTGNSKSSRVSTDHRSPGDQFPMPLARASAARLFPWLFALKASASGAPMASCEPYPLVVLAGLNVARALGLKGPRLLDVHQSPSGRVMVIVFPHPSGVSHFWNFEQNRRRAANLLQSAVEWAIRCSCTAGPSQPPGGMEQLQGLPETPMGIGSHGGPPDWALPPSPPVTPGTSSCDPPTTPGSTPGRKTSTRETRVALSPARHPGSAYRASPKFTHRADNGGASGSIGRAGAGRRCHSSPRSSLSLRRARWNAHQSQSPPSTGLWEAEESGL